MVLIFDLAPELIQQLFETIACSRDFKRLMRLRLVSREFTFPAAKDSLVSSIHARTQVSSNS